SPSGSGTTTPTGTKVWENYGPLSITANANAGSGFLSWTSSTGQITFTGSTSASTTATIHGTGTIMANFGVITTTSVGCTPLSQQAGSSTTCTVTVTGSSPTGTVSWATT